MTSKKKNFSNSIKKLKIKIIFSCKVILFNLGAIVTPSN